MPWGETGWQVWLLSPDWDVLISSAPRFGLGRRVGKAGASLAALLLVLLPSWWQCHREALQGFGPPGWSSALGEGSLLCGRRENLPVEGVAESNITPICTSCPSGRTVVPKPSNWVHVTIVYVLWALGMG